MLPIDEFGLIARLFKPLAAGFPGALELGDDAALIGVDPGREIVATADMLVAGEHFLSGDPADQIAKKAIRTNLSDLAAMGAMPKAVLLTAAFPKDVGLDWLDLFAAGMKADCQEFGIALIGGDTVSTRGPLTLSITALGEVAKGQELRRSNARSGDLVWVSGTIGDGAFGLFVETGEGTGLDAVHAAWLLDRYRLPRPRVALGRRLYGLANAVMDVSDGLVADLGHICETSRVGAVIEAETVPLSQAAKAAIATGWGNGIVTALTGGDDYELLFTAPPEASEAIVALAAELDLPLSPVGRIIDGSGVHVQKSGQDLPVTSTGHKHF